MLYIVLQFENIIGAEAEWSIPVVGILPEELAIEIAEAMLFMISIDDDYEWVFVGIDQI